MSEIDIDKEEILFECMHIEDLDAYTMMRKGIGITPQNAPLSDYRLAIIKNEESPYGFSSISYRNGSWEYMGLGHSGACSLVTGLLKRFQQLTTENKELKKQNNYLERRVKGEIHLGKRYKEDFAEQALLWLKAKEKLEKIKEIATNKVNLKFDITDKLREIKDIIEGEI